jgi:hypothetical protein
MKRFLLVRGKRGPDGRVMPVAHPHHTDMSPPRFAGLRRLDPDKQPAHPVGLVDLYEPEDQAIAEDASILKAIAKGELELIAKVPAVDIAQARELFEKRAQEPAPIPPRPPSDPDRASTTIPERQPRKRPE